MLRYVLNLSKNRRGLQDEKRKKKEPLPPSQSPQSGSLPPESGASKGVSVTVLEGILL
jgi:hypothetical protein